MTIEDVIIRLRDISREMLVASDNQHQKAKSLSLVSLMNSHKGEQLAREACEAQGQARAYLKCSELVESVATQLVLSISQTVPVITTNEETNTLLKS